MKGFILLEVLVSILMSSFVFMSLAAGLFQLSKGLQTIDSVIDASTRASTLYTLLERDFIGTMIPVQAAVAQQKKGKVGEKKSDTKAPEVKESPAQEAAQTAQKKEKPITHIFYSTLEKENANLISCITSDPVPIYWSERAGKAKPRIVRVIYRLKPDPAIEKETSFVLTRQEGPQLDFDAYIKPEGSVPPEHVVISGIKSLRVNYGYIEEKEEEQKAPTDKKSAPAETPAIKKDQKREYKLKNDWPEPPKEESSAVKKESLPLIPSYADISLVLWDPLYKRDQTFSFVINFVSDEEQLETQAALRFVQEKPAPAKPAPAPTPGMKTPAGGPLQAATRQPKLGAPTLLSQAPQLPLDQQPQGKMMSVDELMHIVGDQESNDGAKTEVMAKIDGIDAQGQRYTVFEGPIKITPEMLGKLS
jgi:hypothetical protein